MGDWNERVLPTIVVFGVLILLLAIIGSWIVDADKCHDKGGELVNTFFGFTCVQKK